MTRRFLVPALVVIAIAGGSAVSGADNRTKAAERFALAQAAEKRGDWQAAIDEYEQAYKLEPHPVVLFNIANNFEKLGETRNAARYFVMYLEDAPNAKDSDVVLGRVKKLRELPSRVTFKSKQAGASIFVNNKNVGTAPMALDLPAGRHKVYADHQGTRTTVTQLVLEYGDARTVEFDVHARPGLLIVRANVDGAEIRLDGNVIGYTPFQDSVPSGRHVLVVGMRGYESDERNIEVAPQGSEQIRANLKPLAGTKGEGQPGTPRAAGNFVIGSGYGVNAGSEGLRWQVLLGYRSPGKRFDTNVLLGTFGAEVGGGIGAEGRVFITTGALRPYLRVGAVIGREDDLGNGGGFGFEGGVGILLSPKRNERFKFGYEYFLEANALYVGGEDDPMVEDDGAQVSFPIIGGIAIRFGGS